MSDAEIVFGFTVFVGLIAAFGLGVIAGCVRWDRQRRTIRRLSRSVESLSAQLDQAEADLAEERALVDRITSGTDDIITAARGAHHRTEDPTDV